MNYKSLITLTSSLFAAWWMLFASVLSGGASALGGILAFTI